MATRDELLAAVSERYRTSSRADKSKIIDEFAASTGYHRKHVMRVLRAGPPGRRSAPRPSRRIYGAAEREALIVLCDVGALTGGSASDNWVKLDPRFPDKLVKAVRGVGCWLLTGAPIDTTTAGGKLVFGIFAELAEFERELIGERTKACLASARARGSRAGHRPLSRALSE